MELIRMMTAALAIFAAFAMPVRAGETESELERKADLAVLNPVEKARLAADVSEEEIEQREYPRTSIIGLETPEDVNGLLIRASSPISRVDKLLLDDNRLVLDIMRADCALEAVQEMDDPVIGSVRALSWEIRARVILELKTGVRYSVYLTPDRTGIVVQFQLNEILEVGVHVIEDCDVIAVEGEYCPALTVSPTENDEIQIDLPIAKLKEQSKLVTGRLFNFIKSVKATQIDPETARITIKATGKFDTAVSYEENMATVKLSPKNIDYDAKTQTLSIRKKEGGYPGVEDAQLFNDYSNLAGILTLPGDFMEWLGYSEMEIGDGFLKNITIGNSSSGQTQISMHEEQSLVFSVYDDAEWLYAKMEIAEDADERDTEPTGQPCITYDSETMTLGIRKKEGWPLSAENVKLFDDYTNLVGVLTLPGDYTDWIGYGEMNIHDAFLKSVTIANNSAGRTQLSIHEKRILVFSVYDDADWLYVKIQLPKVAYEKIVIIDPGHGGAIDTGAAHYGLVEKELNLDIAKRMLEILERDGRIKAYATRLADKAMGLNERYSYGNENGDIYVSIHMNATSDYPDSVGTEVYWYPHFNDKALGFTSRNMAGIFQRNLLRDLGSTDRKVRSEDFRVVKNTLIPAVLCEIGFLTNKDEAEKIALPEYRQKAAQALCKAIYETFSVYKPNRKLQPKRLESFFAGLR
ncbi:MAG: N-acetylmuramoyl-L-alanine amidase [Clostridiales bacterium]|jgi:N-acetylmuramoyl-L-alanine amidase|nr:N-acetylmuramoyl-L-alanine amidase [Clostridiales bacterium]